MKKIGKLKLLSDIFLGIKKLINKTDIPNKGMEFLKEYENDK